MLNTFIDTIRGRINRPLQYYEDICVRCGACIDACHFYQASKDPAHIPAYRMALVKKITQSEQGPLANWYDDGWKPGGFSDQELERAIWECTGCRRCAVFCPFNLDTGLLVSAGRYSLLKQGIGPEMIAEIGDAEISKGEIIDAIKEFYVEQAQELAKRLQEEWAPGIQIPVEKKGAEALYVPLVGEHALVPAAKIFYAAGLDWTMSLFTATNHSFFVGDMAKAKEAAHWIVQEARSLGVKTIIYPECGHATRTLLSYFPSWFGDEIAGIERISIVKLVDQYLTEGRIRVKPAMFDTPLTYHDPCNVGRNAGMFEEPRRLLRAVATDFREMTPNRALNWCCGGGGGLIAATEMTDVRMEGGRPKVDQIKQTGARWVTTTCENCKTQLGDLNTHYELGVEIKGVINLIADALILDH
ncbi:MAG: (Fe-S)-binding protein [Chloroflexi bacterium]|nr:(Fe-S)-binding protein [Chloroflexota bacterium]MBU1747637.1 (Fe-S)-binding protein [Chloroflexota bacterium]